MSMWPTVELGDCVDMTVGFPFKSQKFLDQATDAIRLLRGDNVAQGSLRWEGAKHWAAEEAAQYEGYALREHDVILAMDRPWIEAGLKYAYVRRSDLPCLLVQRVARLRGTPALSTDFLRYIIGSPMFTAHVLAITTGVNVPHISGRDIKRFRFALPPLDIQRRIASILGAYDDLIEVNQRRVGLLENMARGLFEEWFVRFRFPGNDAVPIVETLEGPLPEGWRWSSFGELVGEVRDGVSPADLPAETPYIGLEHIPRRSTTMTEWGRAEDVGSLKLYFQRGDVLFGKIRPYFHKVVWAPFDGVASSDAIIYRPREPHLAAISLAVASSDGFVATSVQTSNGTKMPRANPTVLRAYRIATDDGKWASRFGSAMLPTIELAASLAAANHRLAASRDLLLPRLISGQLSVAAAERELLEAA